MANKKQKAKAKKFRNDPGPFPDFFETDNFTKKESKLVTTAVSKPVENKSKKSTKAICDVTGNNVSNVDIVDDKWVSPVQNLFLRLVSAVYLVAFFSFYYQIRGDFTFKLLRFANLQIFLRFIWQQWHITIKISFK